MRLGSSNSSDCATFATCWVLTKRALVFSKEGFTPELLGRCKAYGDVELIDPSRLYGGD